MLRWILHHFVELGGLAILLGSLLAVLVLGRAWPFLVPLPALLAALAWRAWEFSAEATPFVVGIGILGYSGLLLGVGLRQGRTS